MRIDFAWSVNVMIDRLSFHLSLTESIYFISLWQKVFIHWGCILSRILAFCGVSIPTLQLTCIQDFIICSLMSIKSQLLGYQRSQQPNTAPQFTPTTRTAKSCIHFHFRFSIFLQFLPLEITHCFRSSAMHTKGRPYIIFYICLNKFFIAGEFS